MRSEVDQLQCGCLYIDQEAFPKAMTWWVNGVESDETNFINRIFSRNPTKINLFSTCLLTCSRSNPHVELWS